MLYDIFWGGYNLRFYGLEIISIIRMVSLFIIVRRKCGHLMAYYAVHPQDIIPFSLQEVPVATSIVATWEKEHRTR